MALRSLRRAIMSEYIRLTVCKKKKEEKLQEPSWLPLALFLCFILCPWPWYCFLPFGVFYHTLVLPKPGSRHIS